MGVTITVALCIWVAGSLIEYRIISRFPGLEKMFHGLPGMAISIAIGIAVGVALGASTGAGFVLGQTMGLATNSFTFAMWTFLFKTTAIAKQQRARFNEVAMKYPRLFANALGTIKLGILAVVAFLATCLYIIGTPFRLYQQVASRLPHKAKVGSA